MRLEGWGQYALSAALVLIHRSRTLPYRSDHALYIPSMTNTPLLSVPTISRLSAHESPQTMSWPKSGQKHCGSHGARLNRPVVARLVGASPLTIVSSLSACPIRTNSTCRASSLRRELRGGSGNTSLNARRFSIACRNTRKIMQLVAGQVDPSRRETKSQRTRRSDTGCSSERSTPFLVIRKEKTEKGRKGGREGGRESERRGAASEQVVNRRLRCQQFQVLGKAT